MDEEIYNATFAVGVCVCVLAAWGERTAPSLPAAEHK